MLKLNESTDFEDGNLSFLTLGASGFEKKASCEAISSFVNTITPVPGKSYIHVNMLGSSETYGPTRNGDFFSEATLRKYHKTFETNPAKLFKHHMNKKHSPSFGTVIFSTFNENMKRIELIVEVDDHFSEELSRLISENKHPKTSMACRLPHDRCSICNNVAASREDYCVHLKYEMGKIYPDGRRVCAINEDNVSWFDCSIVIVPADPTSSILTKVASNTVMGSVELAELMGITDPLLKSSSLSKWSELIKEITGGEVLQTDVHADKILSNTLDLPLSIVEPLSNFGISEVLSGMAKYGISPSLEFLAELISRKHLGPGYEGIGEIVQEYVKTISADTMVPHLEFKEPENIDPNIFTLLRPYLDTSSLFSEFIEKRSSNIGYAGLGPYPEPTYKEEEALRNYKNNEPEVKTFINMYGKLLAGLGAAALVAKYYLSKQIEKDIARQNQAKIVIIKQASESRVVTTLCTRSLLKSAEQSTDSNEVNSVRLTTSLTRKALKVTSMNKTTVGGKISSILKTIGFGAKVHDNFNRSKQK